MRIVSEVNTNMLTSKEIVEIMDNYGWNLIDLLDDSDKRIITLVDYILSSAIYNHASDVHFEPMRHHYRVRARIDGILYQLMECPSYLSRAIASRLKILAHLRFSLLRFFNMSRRYATYARRSWTLRFSFGDSLRRRRFRIVDILSRNI